MLDHTSAYTILNLILLPLPEILLSDFAHCRAPSLAPAFAPAIAQCATPRLLPLAFAMPTKATAILLPKPSPTNLIAVVVSCQQSALWGHYQGFETQGESVCLPSQPDFDCVTVTN